MPEETETTLRSTPTPGSRSISVGGSAQGSVLNAGDDNRITVHYQRADLPPAENVDIKAELNAIKEVLAQLEAPDQRKIQNALDDAEDELAKPDPDKDEVGLAIDRALSYAKKAEGFSKVIETLKPHLVPFAAWLGANYDKILAVVGLQR